MQFKCIMQYTFHSGCFLVANVAQKLFIREILKLQLGVQFAMRVYLICIMKPF